MSQYTPIALKTYATLKRKGGPIVFTEQLTPPVHDPDTGTVTPGTTAPLPTRALQLEDNPEQLAQLADRGITVANPVTLMVASISDAGAPVRPAVDMPFVWGGDTCSVKSAEALDPAGDTPIYFTIIGNRGPDE